MGQEKTNECSTKPKQQSVPEILTIDELVKLLNAIPEPFRAVRTITEGLRLESGDKLRVTGISPGFVNTNLADSMTNPDVKSQINDQMNKMAIPAVAISRAIAFAIEQPGEVDVNEIVVRPTAQV